MNDFFFLVDLNSWESVNLDLFSLSVHHKDEWMACDFFVFACDSFLLYWLFLSLISRLFSLPNWTPNNCYHSLFIYQCRSIYLHKLNQRLLEHRLNELMTFKIIIFWWWRRSVQNNWDIIFMSQNTPACFFPFAKKTFRRRSYFVETIKLTAVKLQYKIIVITVIRLSVKIERLQQKESTAIKSIMLTVIHLPQNARPFDVSIKHACLVSNLIYLIFEE